MLLDWINSNINAISTVTIAIVTGLFFLAHRFKEDIDEQLIDVRTEVDQELKIYRHDIKNVWLKLNEHAISIVALQTEQRNTASQLVDIKAYTRDINLKLDALSREIADMLVAIRHNVVK